MKYFNFTNDLEFVLTENTNIKFEKHNHISKYVAGIVLHGSVCITENSRIQEYLKDDLFVIPIYSVHTVHMNDSASRLLTMCVGISFIKKYTVEEGREILNHYTNELLKQNIINSVQAAVFEDALDIILQMNQEKEIFFSEKIENVKDIVINEPERELKLEYLSEQIFVSKYYLIRQFKENVGLTPHSFQIQNRIRKAQCMLREGWSVADVAVEMGFYDQSHFVKKFRSIVGVTPREYVDSIKKLIK